MENKIPDVIESIITTPHDHEGEHNKPLWLIWKVDRDSRTDVPYFPVLESVCDSERSARYHYLMAVSGFLKKEVFVERIPANHGFGSSLDDLQMKTHMAMWKARAEYNKREGD
jgi:hypothetical protein